MTDEDAKELIKIAVRHIHDTERDKKYQICVKSPKYCSENDLNHFCAKVASGGEVAEGIHDRVRRAFRIGFIIYEDIIVGTAALKRPTANYRAKVFKMANSQLDPSVYPYELGWIYLDASHRRKGQMTRLIDELLPAAKDSALFATARTSNAIMREMLVQLKFSEEGVDYQSAQNPEDKLNLFVRTNSPVQVDG